MVSLTISPQLNPHLDEARSAQKVLADSGFSTELQASFSDGRSIRRRTSSSGKSKNLVTKTETNPNIVTAQDAQKAFFSGDISAQQAGQFLTQFSNQALSSQMLRKDIQQEALNQSGVTEQKATGLNVDLTSKDFFLNPNTVGDLLFGPLFTGISSLFKKNDESMTDGITTDAPNTNFLSTELDDLFLTQQENLRNKAIDSVASGVLGTDFQGEGSSFVGQTKEFIDVIKTPLIAVIVGVLGFQLLKFFK